ncbi:MAG: TadE family protein [Blastopirellula sp. JB062]
MYRFARFQTTRQPSRTALRRRPGGVVLELILTLPILFILLLAVVEFYFLYANLQRLEAASRAGAIVASRTSLPLSGEIPLEVAGAVDRQLESLNLPARQIIVSHRSAAGVAQIKTGPAYPAPPSLPSLLPAARPAVCVTIRAPMVGLTPNLLKTFGMDIQGRIASQSTTHPHTL